MPWSRCADSLMPRDAEALWSSTSGGWCGCLTTSSPAAAVACLEEGLSGLLPVTPLDSTRSSRFVSSEEWCSFSERFRPAMALSCRNMADFNRPALSQLNGSAASHSGTAALWAGRVDRHASSEAVCGSAEEADGRRPGSKAPRRRDLIGLLGNCSASGGALAIHRERLSAVTCGAAVTKARPEVNGDRLCTRTMRSFL